MKNIAILFGVFVLFIFLSSAMGFDLYIVRHAETMGNVTGDYSDINQCTFSTQGLFQIQTLKSKLAGHSFDQIYVSPTWRTQNTILPYLQANNLTATILPEIEECDCGISGGETPSTQIPMGDEIKIIDGGTNYLLFADEIGNRHYAPTCKEDGLGMLLRARDMLLKRFGNSTNRVLIVTHSCTGGRVMELMLSRKAKGLFVPANASVIHLRQVENGQFEVMLYNDSPITDLQRMALFGWSPTNFPGFIDLAGTWKVLAQDDEAFAQPTTVDTEFLTTQVPGGWEKDALPDYDGIAWYRLTFSVSPEQLDRWADQSLCLLMGAVDDADQTYLNGNLIGSAGEFSPACKTAWDQLRLYEFPATRLGATNVLAVRVDDWGGGGGIWRGPVAIGPMGSVRRTN